MMPAKDRLPSGIAVAHTPARQIADLCMTNQHAQFLVADHFRL
jgi:hypothetical protein